MEKIKWNEEKKLKNWKNSEESVNISKQNWKLDEKLVEN